MDANTFHPLLHDRGRGPELRSTRLTVYNVWDELFHPDTTEAELCRRYEITPEEVAALRAFAFRHYAEVAEVIRRMDERTARGMAEQAEKFGHLFAGSRERLLLFKDVLEEEKKRNGGILPNSVDERAKRWATFQARLNGHPSGAPE